MNQTIIYTAEMEQNLVAVERTRQYFNNSLENINESPTASLYSAKNPEGIQEHIVGLVGISPSVCQPKVIVPTVSKYAQRPDWVHKW